MRFDIAMSVVVIALAGGLMNSPQSLAEKGKVSNCDAQQPSESTAKPPFKVAADMRGEAKAITISWEVCQPSEFYQVSWGQASDPQQLVKVEGSDTRQWTARQVLDKTNYTFMVQGCNAQPDQTVACSPPSEVLNVKTPDW
jgi:hypothetical protein